MSDDRAIILRNVCDHGQRRGGITGREGDSINGLFHATGLPLHRFLYLVADMVDAGELCLCPDLRVSNRPTEGERRGEKVFPDGARLKLNPEVEP